MNKFLIKNGFSEKEADIYLCILESGELPISMVARKVKLKRTTVYNSIESMKNKGILFTNKKKNIQYVSALSPQLLLNSFNIAAQEKIKSLEKNINESQDILPDFIKIQASSSLKPRLHFFDGKDGVKQLLREFALSKIQSMGFSDYEQMPEELVSFIRKQIIPQRRKNKNKAKFIIPNNKTNRMIQSEDSKFFSEHKLINFPIHKNPIELLLFDKSKIAFISFVRDEQFGLLIDSEAIHNSLKNIFNYIWTTKN